MANTANVDVDVTVAVEETGAVVTLKLNNGPNSCKLTEMAAKVKEVIEDEYNKVSVICGSNIYCTDGVCQFQAKRRRSVVGENTIELHAGNKEKDKRLSTGVWIIVGSGCAATVALVATYLLRRNKNKYAYLDMPTGRFL